MKKLIIVTSLSAVYLIPMILGAIIYMHPNYAPQPAQEHTDLSYATYYDQTIAQVNGHAVMQPCTFVKHSYLDKSNPAQPFENFYFTCAESGKNPTIAQQQFWIEYVLAKSCNDGEKLACDADPAD